MLSRCEERDTRYGIETTKSTKPTKVSNDQQLLLNRLPATDNRFPSPGVPPAVPPLPAESTLASLEFPLERKRADDLLRSSALSTPCTVTHWLRLHGPVVDRNTVNQAGPGGTCLTHGSTSQPERTPLWHRATTQGVEGRPGCFPEPAGSAPWRWSSFH